MIHKLQSIKLLGIISSVFLLLASMTNVSEKSIKLEAQTTPTNINITDQNGTALATYYSGINGLKGDPLLAALSQIIDGHREYDYESDTDRLAYKIMDRNWTLSPLTSAQLSNFNYTTDNGFIRKFYADYNDSALTADRFKNDGAPRVSFDKEHIWAQSMGNFGRTGGAGSDFHMLVPSDVIGNQNAHSNYNFSVPQSSITTYNGDKGTYVGRNGNIPGGSLKVFEPLDQYKGDIARAMFYMPARYYTYVDTLHPKLTLVNGSPAAVTASPTQAGLAGDLATLLQWHELDPVDEYEIHRNNLIYNNYQLNRNPFIDFPELAKIAYDTSYTGSGANITSSSACLIDSCPYYSSSTATLNDLVITNPATTVDYLVGDTISTSGLEVTAHYSNFTSAVVTSYTLSISGETGTIFTTGGTKTVTISYQEGGLTEVTSFDVYVAATATLAVTPTVTSIKLGSTYVDNGITGQLSFTTINGTFNRSLTKAQLTIGPVNTMQLGVQSISVTFGSYQTTFNVTVTNQGVTVGTVAPDLFFSEYIEGSSNNKALEIYNGTGVPVNMSGYTVKFYANANYTPSSTLNLTGTIAAGDVYVIYNSASAPSIISVGDISSAVAGYNGNDAITLDKSGQIIDIIGTVAANLVFAADVTLVRKSSVFSGKTTYDANEWDSYPIDTFTYLGSHTVNWVSAGVSAANQALSYATYFRSVTSDYCVGGTKDVLTIPWASLKTEYNYMAAVTKDEFFTSTNVTIMDARARYTLLVNRYSIYASDNFMVDGDGTLLVQAPKNPTSDFQHGNLILIILLGFGLGSISLFFVLKRKHVL